MIKRLCIVDTDFPMMQFQGADEMIRARDLPGAKMPLLRRIEGTRIRQVLDCLDYSDLDSHIFSHLPQDFE